MFLFLTVIQAIVAAALVGVVLMQRSEGGGLGIGGSPSGMMSARGAADFLTRATKWLAIAFVALAIVMAAIAVESAGTDEISTTLDRDVPADPISQNTDNDAAVEQVPADTPNDDPLAGATN